MGSPWLFCPSAYDLAQPLDSGTTKKINPKKKVPWRSCFFSDGLGAIFRQFLLRLVSSWLCCLVNRGIRCWRAPRRGDEWEHAPAGQSIKRYTVSYDLPSNKKIADIVATISSDMAESVPFVIMTRGADTFPDISTALRQKKRSDEPDTLCLCSCMLVYVTPKRREVIIRIKGLYWRDIRRG